MSEQEKDEISSLKRMVKKKVPCKKNCKKVFIRGGLLKIKNVFFIIKFMESFPGFKRYEYAPQRKAPDDVFLYIKCSMYR